MTNKDLDRYAELDRLDYEPDYNYILNEDEKKELQSLKAKLEGELEDSEKLRGLPIPEECNLYNGMTLEILMQKAEKWDNGLGDIIKHDKENRQLALALTGANQVLASQLDEIKQFKEEAQGDEKIISMLTENNRNLKQKLEQIEELYREYDNEIYDEVKWKEMKKELKEKLKDK